MKSAYGMFDSYGGDLLTQKSRDVEAAANSKVAGMDPRDSEALAQFRAANPNATPEAERIFLTGLAYSKAANQNSGLLGDIGTGLAISFGDRVPEMAGGLVGLLTGSQSAMDYVAKQQREAEQSREEYSVGTQEAQQEIRRLDAEREASYKGRERTAGDTAMDFLSTLGDYIANPRAAVAEAAESGADIALMMVGGGAAGSATKAAVKQTAAKRLLAESAAKAAGNRGNAAAMNLLTKAGFAKEKVTEALAKEGVGDILRNKALTKVAADLAEKAGNKAAGRAAGAVGAAYTGYSEGVSNGIQTYQEVMGLSDATLNNSKDFRKFKEENPNLSKDELKKQYALSLAKQTAVQSGTLAAAIGKLTGASDNASKALLGKNGLKNLASKSTIGGITEFVEEAFQSGGGQLLSNINVAKADESKDTLQGVGHVAGSGAASGGILGASMAPIGSAAKLSAKAAILGAGATVATAKGVANVVGAIGDAIRSSVSSNKETKEESDLLDYADEQIEDDEDVYDDDEEDSEGETSDAKYDEEIESVIKSNDDLTKVSDHATRKKAMEQWADVNYNPDNSKDRAKLENYISENEKEIRRLRPQLRKAASEEEQKAISNKISMLEDSNVKLRMHQKHHESTARVKSTIKKVKSGELSLGHEGGIDDLNIALRNAKLDRLSDEDLKDASEIKGLDKGIRAKLSNELALRSTMQDVSTHFQRGGKSSELGDVKGVKQHIEDFANAIKSGDRAKMDTTATNFKNWYSRQQEKAKAFANAKAAMDSPNPNFTEIYKNLNKDAARFRQDSNTKEWAPVGVTDGDKRRTLTALANKVQQDFNVLENARKTLESLAKTAKENAALDAAKEKTKAKVLNTVTAPENTRATIKWSAKNEEAPVERNIKSISTDSNGNYQVVTDNPLSELSNESTIVVTPNGKIVSRSVEGGVTSRYKNASVSPETLDTIKKVAGNTTPDKPTGNPTKDKVKDTAKPKDTTESKGKKSTKSKSKKEENPNQGAFNFEDTAEQPKDEVKQKDKEPEQTKKEEEVKQEEPTKPKDEIPVEDYMFEEEAMEDFFDDLDAYNQGNPESDTQSQYETEPEPEVETEVKEDTLVLPEINTHEPAEKESKSKKKKTVTKIPFNSDSKETIGSVKKFVMDYIKENTASILGQQRKLIEDIFDAANPDIPVNFQSYEHDDMPYVGAFHHDYDIFEENGKQWIKTSNEHIDINLILPHQRSKTGIGSTFRPITLEEVVETIIHEVDHSGISIRIREDSIQSEENQPARFKALVELYDTFVAKVNSEVAAIVNGGKASSLLTEDVRSTFNYITGKRSLDIQLNEFVTAARTNKAFAEYLKSVRSSENSKRTIYERLMYILTQYFKRFSAQKDMSIYAGVVALSSLYQQNGHLGGDINSNEAGPTSKTKTTQSNKSKDTASTKQDTKKKTAYEELAEIPKSKAFEYGGELRKVVDRLFNETGVYGSTEGMGKGALNDLLSSIPDDAQMMIMKHADAVDVDIQLRKREKVTIYSSLDRKNADGELEARTPENVAYGMIYNLDEAMLYPNISNELGEGEWEGAGTARAMLMQLLLDQVSEAKRKNSKIAKEYPNLHNRAMPMLDLIYNKAESNTPARKAVALLHEARFNGDIAKFLDVLPLSREMAGLNSAMLRKYPANSEKESFNLLKEGKATAYSVAVGLAQSFRTNQDFATKEQVDNFKKAVAAENLRKTKESTKTLSNDSVVSEAKLYNASVMQLTEDGNTKQGKLLNYKILDNGARIELEVEFQSKKGNVTQVIHTRPDGQVIKNGSPVAGSTVALPNVDEYGWAKKATNRVTNMFGMAVHRFKENFFVDTRNGGILTRTPDLFNKDTSEWNFDHPRKKEFAESESIKDFQNFLAKHKDDIRATIVSTVHKGEMYRYQNWVSDLVDIGFENNQAIVRDIPEALVSAVALSMYYFILQDAKGTIRTSVAKQLEILERIYGPNSVTPQIANALKDGGVHKTALLYNLGNTAIEVLGISTNRTAALNARENLKNSLGGVVLQTLINTGIVTKTSLTGHSIIKENIGKMPEIVKLPAYYKYAGGRIMEDGSTQLSEEHERSAMLNKKEHRLLGSVVKVTREPELPSVTPSPDKKVRKKKGGGTVTKKVTELLNKKEKIPHEFNPHMEVFLNAGEDTFRDLMRAVNGYTQNLSAHIDVIADSKADANDLIDRTVGHIYELRKTLTDTGEFFYKYKISTNHREHQESQLSIQNNKIARNLISIKNSRTPLVRENLRSISTKAKKGEYEKNDLTYGFFKGVGQGLGVDEEDFSTTTEYMAAVLSKLKEPAIVDAIKVIIAVKSGKRDLSSAIESIKAGVEAGGNKTHSFLALVEYAGYSSVAVNAEYVTSIYVENDGKTSALALGETQLSTNSTKNRLGRTGILVRADEGKSQLTSFSEFDGDDAYLSMAKYLGRSLDARAGIDYLFGPLYTEEGKISKVWRNLAKPATMPPMYGQSSKEVAGGMARSAIIPELMEKLDTVKTEAELAKWVDVLNSFVHYNVNAKFQIYKPDGATSIRDYMIKIPSLNVQGEGIAPAWNSNPIYKTVKEFRLPGYAKRWLTETMEEEVETGHDPDYGDAPYYQESIEGVIPHSTAIKSVAGTTIKSQKLFGEMAQAMGEIYIAAFEEEKEKIKERRYEEFKSKGFGSEGGQTEKSSRAKFESIFELTYQEVDEIKKNIENLFPGIPDALYVPGEDAIDSQINMLDEAEEVTSTKDNNPYRVSLPTRQGQDNVGDIPGIKRSLAPRTAGAGAMATQALDAGIALGTQSQSDEYAATLNNHDANAAGIATAHNITEDYNAAFGDMAIDKYSYFEEMYNSLERVVAAREDLAKKVFFERWDTDSMSLEPVSLPALLKGDYFKTLEAIQKNRKYLQDNVEVLDQYVGAPYKYGEKRRISKGTSTLGMSIGGDYQEKQLYTPKDIGEVFKQLGVNNTQDSPAHTMYLINTMSVMRAKGLKDIEIIIEKEVGRPYEDINATDMMVVNNRRGPNRYARKSRGAITMSAQEFYVNELAYAVGGYWVDNSSAVRSELKKMYTLAADAAKKNPELWEKHKGIFDDVFNPRTVEGKSTYLQNFFSAAVSNAGMRQLLARTTVPTAKDVWAKGDTYSEKIANFLNTMVGKLRGELKGIKNTQANKRMNELLRHIVTLDANNRSVAKEGMDKIGSFLDGKFSIFNKSLAELLEKPAKYAKETKITAVSKILSPLTITHTLLTKGADYLPLTQYIKSWTRQAVYAMVEHNNVLVREIGDLLLQATGRTERNTELVNAFHATKQSADRARMQILPRVASILKSSFDPKKELTPSKRKALTYVLAKTDLSSLLDLGSTVNHALNLVSNTELRKSEIVRVTRELDSLVKGDPFYRMQAQNLGWLSVDGKGLGLHLPRYNAYSIAKGRDGDVTVNPAIVKLVDQLASLHALDYLPASVLEEANDVIQHEMHRTDEEGNPLLDNGILNTLYTLADIKEEAKNNLFKGAEGLMQKGYIGDRFPARMQMAFSTDKADKDLLSKGYTLYQEVGYDPTTGHKGKRYLYISPYGGLAKLETGAFVLDAKHSRGTDVTPPDGVSEYDMNSKMSAVKAAMDNAIYASKVFKVKKGMLSTAMPKWDTEGRITGYRMMMSEELKDSLMQRDTDIFSVVADLRASSYIKGISNDLNKDTLNALKTIYDTWGESSPEDFVFISEKSERKTDRDYWNSLPYETRASAIKMFGERGIPVRRDSRAIAFGTREWAITDIWNKPHKDRRLVEKVIHSVATQFFGNDAAVTLSKTTDFMETLGRIAKDAIVIRGFLTTVGNTLSNLLLNTAQGINPFKQLKWGAEAYNHAQKYLKGAARLIEIETLLTNKGLSKGKMMALKQEDAIIREDMRVSPVRELIESGALQNIEDITKDEEDTMYNAIPYADKISNRYRKIVKKDSWVDDVLNTAAVSQTSRLYKELRVAAQMSDFVAKYAYVQSRTKDAKNKIPMDVAVQQANDLFIDYQLPSGVIVSSLNRLGFLYFTKYVIRVQKTILKTAIDNPARSLLVMMGANWIGMAPSIFGSFMDNPLSRLSNPISMFLDSLDEPIVINTLT